MEISLEWDRSKADSNMRKHGVSFEEATGAFYDALSRTIADPIHSTGEARFVLLGVSRAGRLLVVSHLDRGRTIRIISARPASRKERKAYEENLV